MNNNYTNEEMITVCIFADTTNQFTEEELDADNTCDMEFPRRIVYEYYKQREAEFVEETSDYLGIFLKDCSFDKWVNEVANCDDLCGLYDFALQRGYQAILYGEPAKWCGSVDGHEIEVCPHCGMEVELRWDINKDGFKAFCPYCGKRLMLCDACNHRYGYCSGDCDYCSATDTCRFNKEGN